jgi:membrane protease YdiL (CAAX protease family)
VSRRRALEIGVLSFALIFPTLLTWAYFVDAAGSGSRMKLFYAVGKVLQFSLPVLFWLVTDRSRLRPGWPRVEGLLAGVIFGLLVGAATVVLYFGYLRHQPLITPLASQVRQKVTAFGLTSPGKFLIFAVFLSLIHAGLEEYYWRAFLFAGWRKLLPLHWAIAISSFGFMAHHVVVLNEYFPGRFWTATMPFALAVAVGGAVWAVMYERYGSIYPAWISDALVDAALMAVGYNLLFG